MIAGDCRMKLRLSGPRTCHSGRRSGPCRQSSWRSISDLVYHSYGTRGAPATVTRVRRLETRNTSTNKARRRCTQESTYTTGCAHPIFFGFHGTSKIIRENSSCTYISLVYVTITDIHQNALGPGGQTC